MTLVHGDWREHRDLILSGDVLVTDPPYGITYTSNHRHTLWNDKFHWYSPTVNNDDTSDARDELLAAWGDRPALVFGTWKQPAPPNTRAVLVWDKGGGAGMGDLSLPWKQSHEQIYVLGKGFHGHRGEGVLRCSVAPRVSMGRTHPTEKPVPLLEALIAKCPPGVVVDPFAGTGSTLVAAQRLGRDVIGTELVEAYVNVARQRLAQGVIL